MKYKFVFFSAVVSLVLAVAIYFGWINYKVRNILKPLTTIGYVLTHQKHY